MWTLYICKGDKDINTAALVVKVDILSGDFTCPVNLLIISE